MIRVQRFALGFAILLLFLAGCDVTGAEFETFFFDDGSSEFVLALGFLEKDEDGDGKPDNSIDCTITDSEDVARGATAVREQRGNETWCIMTMPLTSLAEYRTLLNELQLFRVDCLAIIDGLLYLDITYDPSPLLANLEPGETMEDADTPTTFSVRTTNRINSHNADLDDTTAKGLTWNITLDQITQMRINLAEGEMCPAGMSMDLFVLVRDDNSGLGEITMTFPAEEAMETLFSDYLTANGWSITSVGGSGQVTAEKKVSDTGGYTPMLLSAPGFEASGSLIRLVVEEDNVTGLKLWDMVTKLNMDAYVTNWVSILDDGLPPPRFHYSVLLPGDVENTFASEWASPEAQLFKWSPGDPTRTFSLHAQSANEVRQTNLDEIIRRYTANVPKGPVITNPTTIQSMMLKVLRPGQVNNMTLGSNDFACGGYQNQVLNFLTDIRNSQDAPTRHLMMALDFGPVQSYHGYHQAVVLYPRGTDWLVTGIVLDPWPNQVPEVVPIKDWKDLFGYGIGSQGGIGPGAAPSNTDLSNYYPHLTGGAPQYPTDLPKRPFPLMRSVILNSPVDVLITASDGRRLGLTPDGEPVNEIEGAFMYRFPKEDGTVSWLVQVPEGEYETQIVGAGEGHYHLMVGDAAGTLVAYGAQPISLGQQASLTLAPDRLTMPLIGVDGAEIAAIPVTAEVVEELLTSPLSAGGGSALGNRVAAWGGGGNRWVAIGAVGLAVVLVVLAGVVVWRRR